MHRHELTDEQWARLEGLLPGRRGGHGGVARDNRLFMNAVWYVAKTGVPWRDLPERFGKWDTTYHRYNEWCKKKVWQRILEVVQDPDLERLMLDSTIIRSHQHAAGMNGGEDDQALGRSRRIWHENPLVGRGVGPTHDDLSQSGAGCGYQPCRTTVERPSGGRSHR